LLIVGGGAKAAAIAAKVHAINSLGLGPIALTVIEKTEFAASWLGRHGMTSGEEPLAIPPTKDVGFPYQSDLVFGEAGEAIDAAVLPFTWQQYMISQREYARWVNADSPSVRHRDYGQYLAWVLSRATEGVTLVSGTVTQVDLEQGAGRWTVEVGETSGPSRYASRALVLTGPGVHRVFPHDAEVASRVLHCDSKRSELSCVPTDRSSEIAIVGGGESALSCLVFLRPLRPEARMTVYTPTLPLSRGESFLENRVFSNPDSVSWSSLDLQTRRDFIKHTDRGVFDPQTLSKISYDGQCRFVTGRVLHVGAADGGEGISLRYESPEGVVAAKHDYVVNCTGFDLLAQLRGLFSAEMRAEIERRVGPLWDGPAKAEIPIGRSLELEGITPRLHIPGLSGLSQGPGFANLGSLGLLANRVLQPLLLDQGQLAERFEITSTASTVSD
jgi:mycobactin lysine-N-oxygenase